MAFGLGMAYPTKPHETICEFCKKDFRGLLALRNHLEITGCPDQILASRKIKLPPKPKIDTSTLEDLMKTLL